MEYDIWTIIVGLSGAFGLGMCFSLLGSISVKLMPRMEIDEGKFGSMISAFMFSCLIFSLIAKYPAADPGFVVGDALALLAQPLTWIAAAVLFCYIALESSFSNWLAPFGKEVISMESPDMETGKVDAAAARLLSAFAIAMMIGRLIAGLSGITAAGGWLIAGGALVSALVILSMTKAASGKSAYILAAVAGLVFGPIFPTTVGVTFGKMGASGSLMGIIFAIGLLGAVTVPKAIGNMASGKSVQHSLKLLLPPCAALLILAVILHVMPAP